MATIPGTKFTESVPPAETGQMPWSPSLASTGGEQAITAGIGKLGSAITAYAINTMKQEMAIEFSERERMIDERGWIARNSVTGNEEADKKLWENFKQEVQAIANSSKYKDVNNDLTMYINKVSPNWEQGIYISSLNKRRENIKDQFNLEMENLLENGLVTEANDLAEKAYNLGSITQAEYNNFVKTAPTESRLLKAQRLAELGNLTAAKAELEMLKPEDLTNKQLKQRRSILEYEIKKAQEQKENEVLDIAFGFAEKGDFRSGIEEIMKARTELGSDSFIDALNKYQNAFRILNDTGNNVYKETQNWQLYWEDYQKAIDGEITELEARSHVGQDGYATPQFKEIKAIIDGSSSKATAFENTQSAKLLAEMVQDYGKEAMIPETNINMLREKGYRLLQDAIKSSERPLTDREKKEVALRIFNNLKTEKVTTEPEFLMTPSERQVYLAETIEKDLNKIPYEKLPKAKPEKKILRNAKNPKTGERMGWDGEKWIKL